MSENIFQQVRGINELAGNPLAVNIADLLKQGKIIQSELYEFLQGLADYDLKEIRDGQGDIIFTALGLPGRSGFPFVGDMQTICDNQFAKFDLSVEDAEKTREKYLSEGVETNWHQGQYDGRTYYVTTSAKDQMYRGKPIGKGKWLKSWKWAEPEFSVIDADRTPWVGTQLTEQKLTALKAELAVQGYIAKYGAVEIAQLLDRAFMPRQEALTDDQAVAITNAMDELDRLRVINSPMPTAECPSMCLGDTGDAGTLREAVQEELAKPADVTIQYQYGATDTAEGAVDISKGAFNATI